jgi:deoxyribonuclease-4
MQRKIGAHVSTAGGLENGVIKAQSIGCNCFQLFSGSPRIWQRKKLAEVETEKYFAEREKWGIGPVITHALYLVNLASDKAENVQKSFNSLKYELEFDAAIQGGGVVVHLGSHQGRGWASAKDQVAKVVGDLLRETPENSTFLIENAAGQNGKVGDDLGEIRELLEVIEKDGQFVSKGRIGWCFDTCHAHAAGYYLGESVPENVVMAEKITRQPQSALKTISEQGLWEMLKCIHVNDSRDPFGSGKDRHANLGDGNIPQEDLRHFLHFSELKHIPLILEVPGLDGEGPDAANVERLKKILE